MLLQILNTRRLWRITNFFQFFLFLYMINFTHSCVFYKIETLFVLNSRQKISLPRIENPAVDTGTFLPPPIDLFPIPPFTKLLGSLEGDLLNSQMPEKSSGPRTETFLHSSMS